MVKYNILLKSDKSWYKLCRVLIIIGIAFTPFISIPSKYIPTGVKFFISYESYLSVYPFLLFSLLFFVLNIKNGNLTSYKPLFVFYVFYFVINFLVCIHGLIIYPGYDALDYGKLAGADRIAFNVVSSLLQSVSSDNVWVISTVLKSILTIHTKFISSFFVVFSIFFFYKQTNYDFLNDLWLGVSCVLPLLFVYEIFEIAYLLNYDWGRKLLIFINPFLYEIESMNGWWPPLLWDNQVRSVFQEPSFLGYWGAICIPIFMGNIVNKKNVLLNTIEFCFICFLLFSSNSRTGVALALGVILVFCALEIYKYRLSKIINIIYLLSFVVVVFLCSSYFIAYSQRTMETNIHIGNSEVVKDFIDDNLKSIIQEDARSNKSRYGLTQADFMVFKNHPVMGVGEQLIGNYLADAGLKIGDISLEYQDWIKNQQNNGNIGNVFPSLNEYARSLSTGGVIGFCVNTLPFLLLVVFSLYVFFFKAKYLISDSITVAISMGAVVIAFGLSNVFVMNYFYYVVYACFLCFMENILYQKNNGSAEPVNESSSHHKIVTEKVKINVKIQPIHREI